MAELDEVAELRALLNDREQDLVLAAEYGQALLETNQTLREQLATARAAQTEQNGKVVRAADYEHYRRRVNELEQTVAELQEQLGERKLGDDAEDRGLARRVRTAEDAAATAERALADALADAAASDSRVAAVEAGNARLADELRVAKHDAAEQARLMGVMQSNLDALRGEWQQWSVERLALERRCARLEEDGQRAQHDAELYEAMTVELDRVKEERDALMIQADELHEALEDARHTMEFLKRSLQADGKAESAEETARLSGKTLLHEVEDRRAEMEAKHKQLMGKHQGLLRKHLETEQRQERMRNHINRLTQMGSGGAVLESATRRLETALAQSESDNKQLRLRIASLEKRLRDGDVGLAGGEDDGPESEAAAVSRGEQWERRLRLAGSDGASVNEAAALALQHRLQETEATLQSTQRELRTLQMAKLSETERLRAAESRLQETEARGHRLQAMVAQLRFQLEEKQAGAADVPPPKPAPATTTPASTAPTTTTPAAASPAPAAPATSATPATSAAPATSAVQAPVTGATHVTGPASAVPMAPVAAVMPQQAAVPENQENVTPPARPTVAAKLAAAMLPQAPAELVVQREAVSECTQQ